jgi:hypothetical protein
MAVSHLLDAMSRARRGHGVSAAREVLWGWVRRVDELDLLVLDEPRVPPRALAASEGHEFRFATEQDLIDIAKIHPEEAGEQDLEFLAHGDRCLMQMDGDVLTGFAWIAGSPLVHLQDGYHFNLPDHMVYNYHAFTAPEYRGFAFQGLRHNKLLEALAPEGKTALFGFVNRLNFSSQKGVAKSGYRKVGRLTFRKMFGRVSQKLVVDDACVSRSRRT